jgi:hypothetical protein
MDTAKTYEWRIEFNKSGHGHYVIAENEEEAVKRAIGIRLARGITSLVWKIDTRVWNDNEGIINGEDYIKGVTPL